MQKRQLNSVLKKHQLWLAGQEGGERANLEQANLEQANLWGANLWGANLEWANLDFSCWPLWCGTKVVIVDKRIAAQLAAHFCIIVCDDEEVKAAQEALLPLARQSHRARDLELV